MVAKRNVKKTEEATEVVAVKDASISNNSNDNGEETFTVKLDSKRFEGRTPEQVVNLFLGSTGVVNKITIERE